MLVAAPARHGACTAHLQVLRPPRLLRRLPRPAVQSKGEGGYQAWRRAPHSPLRAITCSAAAAHRHGCCFSELCYRSREARTAALGRAAQLAVGPPNAAKMQAGGTLPWRPGASDRVAPINLCPVDQRWGCCALGCSRTIRSRPRGPSPAASSIPFVPSYQSIATASVLPAMAAPSRAAARRAAAAPPLLVLLLLLAMAGSAAAARPEPKGAKITLRAKWPGTPLLHEAAEFLVRRSCAAGCGGGHEPCDMMGRTGTCAASIDAVWQGSRVTAYACT